MTKKQIIEDSKETCCVGCARHVSKKFARKHNDLCAECYEIEKLVEKYETVTKNT